MDEYNISDTFRHALAAYGIDEVVFARFLKLKRLQQSSVEAERLAATRMLRKLTDRYPTLQAAFHTFTALAQEEAARTAQRRQAMHSVQQGTPNWMREQRSPTLAELFALYEGLAQPNPDAGLIESLLRRAAGWAKRQFEQFEQAELEEFLLATMARGAEKERSMPPQWKTRFEEEIDLQLADLESEDDDGKTVAEIEITLTMPVAFWMTILDGKGTQKRLLDWIHTVYEEGEDDDDERKDEDE